MNKELEFEQTMKTEIQKRVDYYENSKSVKESHFSAANFYLAGLIFIVGLIMTIAGSYV